MKIYYQWSTNPWSDWSVIDSSQWGTLQFRGVPQGGEIIDGQGGWVYALCVMGTVWSGYDHYAVEHFDDGSCKIYAWMSDLDDISGMPYDFYARVSTYWPLTEDSTLGGAINTRGIQLVFCQEKVGKILQDIGPVQNKVYLPWDEFSPPESGITAHGVWLPDSLSDEHYDKRSTHSWREWSEGVDASRLDRNGNVAIQRPLGFYSRAEGTKTFNLRGTNQASGVHATATSDFENVMDFGAASEAAESQNIGGGASLLTHLWSTESGEPDAAQFPTGNYRCFLDNSTLGVDVTFGLRAAGSVNGHFARVNSGLTSDLETKDQTQALFGDPAGLKTATTGSVSWSSGDVGDRFECLVGATRAASHGNQPIEMAYDGDGIVDGPWITIEEEWIGTEVLGQQEPVREKNEVVSY